ncbi:hypothetical protein T484DRAFT_1970700 [Baffinella frigidus]|nr:hypothetical protein T484DRAFT_1970700 [Cryptophyta sp. CCMP2293]
MFMPRSKLPARPSSAIGSACFVAGSTTPRSRPRSAAGHARCVVFAPPAAFPRISSPTAPKSETTPTTPTRRLPTLSTTAPLPTIALFLPTTSTPPKISPTGNATTWTPTSAAPHASLVTPASTAGSTDTAAPPALPARRPRLFAKRLNRSALDAASAFHVCTAPDQRPAHPTPFRVNTAFPPTLSLATNRQQPPATATDPSGSAAICARQHGTETARLLHHGP